MNKLEHKEAPLSCINCLKRSHSLLAGLNGKDLEVVNKNRIAIDYSADEIIYKQGTKPQFLFCLNKGNVKIVNASSSGKSPIIGLKKPTDFLGFSDLVMDELYHSSGIALDEVTTCLIPKSTFNAVLNSNIEFANKTLKYFAGKLTEADRRFVSLTQKNIRGRLANVLLLLYEIYGASKTNGFLNVSLKRSDIAALSNMDVSNASRFLSEFVKDEIIELDKRKIKIRNLVHLKMINDRY